MSILSHVDPAGVATVTLNRPAVRNAFDEAMIAALTQAFTRLSADPGVRALVLKGAGESFSAGGDLDWMRRMAGRPEEENLADAQALGRLMETLDTVRVPTIAAVAGAAFGGAVGLIACCDIAIAADSAVFSLSEVRLGLVPAVIGPYVVRAIGPRAARRYALTAERISALEAHRIGLVHEVVPGHLLEGAVATVLGRLAEGGPEAQRAAKGLIAAVAGRPPAEVAPAMGRLIAEVRAGEEGREGVAAFLEKRVPRWRRP